MERQACARCVLTVFEEEKYDCPVMCSGGRGSTASVNLMLMRYRMPPLAFTFDLGFETEEMLREIAA